MKTPKNKKAVVATIVVAGGLLLGGASVANAVTSEADEPTQELPAVQIAPAAQTAPESEDILEIDEVEDGVEHDNESPEEEAAEEAAEQELLNSFPITPEQATVAALAVVPGTVEEVELEDDHGSTPVFEVEVIDAAGQEITVTVDPTSGQVIDQVAEGPEGADEGPDDGADDEGAEGAEDEAADAGSN